MTSIARAEAVLALAGLLTMWVPLPTSATETAPVAFNNHCRTCHSATEGDHRLGPSLHNVYGAKAGSSPTYPGYSQGLKSSGITWDEATLDKALAPYRHEPFKWTRTQPTLEDAFIHLMGQSEDNYR